MRGDWRRVGYIRTQLDRPGPVLAWQRRAALWAFSHWGLGLFDQGYMKLRLVVGGRFSDRWRSTQFMERNVYFSLNVAPLLLGLRRWGCTLARRVSWWPRFV